MPRRIYRVEWESGGVILISLTQNIFLLWVVKIKIFLPINSYLIIFDKITIKCVVHINYFNF